MAITTDALDDGGKLKPRQGIPGGSGLLDSEDKLRDKLPKVIVNFKIGGVKMAREVEVELSAPGVLVAHLDIDELIEKNHKLPAHKTEMPKNVFTEVAEVASFSRGRSGGGGE